MSSIHTPSPWSPSRSRTRSRPRRSRCRSRRGRRPTPPSRASVRMSRSSPRPGSRRPGSARARGGARTTLGQDSPVSLLVSGNRQRDPVVLSDRVGLDEHEVPVGLRVVGDEERQLIVVGCHGEGVHQTLIPDVGPLRVHVVRRAVRLVWAGDPRVPLPGRRARELWVGAGLQDAARGDERLRRRVPACRERLVDRPRTRCGSGEGNVGAGHREGLVVVGDRGSPRSVPPSSTNRYAPSQYCRKSSDRKAPVVRLQVHGVAQRRGADRVVVERVRELPPGVTPRVQEPAAFVEEGPDLQHHRVRLRLGSGAARLAATSRAGRWPCTRRRRRSGQARRGGRGRAHRVHVVDVVRPSPRRRRRRVGGQERRSHRLPCTAGSSTAPCSRCRRGSRRHWRWSCPRGT